MKCFCGRELVKGECVCLYTNGNKLTNIQTSILTALVVFFPQVVALCYCIFYKIENVEKQLVTFGSLILTTIVLTVLILEKIFKSKVSLIAVFFNCHQKVERSIQIGNYISPICTRCFGILFGIVFLWLVKIPNLKWYIYILLALPLVIDGVVQLKTKYVSNNIKRVITGLLFSIPVCFVTGFFYIKLITLLSYIINKF